MKRLVISAVSLVTAAALADIGGLTKMMALLDGSPAINAGPDPVATDPVVPAFTG
jgi:hypothetical protein